MTDAEIAAALRTRIAYHETEAERCRQALRAFEADGPVKPPKGKRRAAPKKREGEQRRPPSKGKRGQTSQRVAEYVASHPEATPTQVGRAVGISPATTSYHLAKLRKAAR